MERGSNRIAEAVEREAEGRPGLLGYGVVTAMVGLALLLYALDAQGLSMRGDYFVAGEILGITAAVLLPVAAILAVRLKPLESLFGDTTKVYIAHGIIGLTMFAIVTVHPLLYVAGGLALPDSTLTGSVEVIVPFHVVVLDWTSWILIALAMLPTLYLRLPFDLWRYTHVLLVGAVVVTGVSLVITSTTFDTIEIGPLRIYLGILFVLATLAGLYVAIGRRLIEPKHEYRVDRVDHHPEAEAIELHLSPVGRPLKYEAGQFTYVDLLDTRAQLRRGYEAHPFSIASSPREPDLRVIVRALGDYTERAQRVGGSDEARALVHGAYGRLHYRHAHSRMQAWIGGGIGVSPFLGLAAELADNPAKAEGHDIVLVAAVETRAHAFYMGRLEEYDRRCPNLQVMLWASDERGIPTVEELKKVIPRPDERSILLAGPPAMVTDLTEQFEKAGLPRDRLHSETLIGPPPRWRQASRALRIARWVVTVELVVFVVAVLASTVGRAV